MEKRDSVKESLVAITLMIAESKAEEKRALQENKWNFREKYIWKSVFYYAMLSETVAFAEVELDSGELRTAGGLWKSYMGECRENKEKICSAAGAESRGRGASGRYGKRPEICTGRNV